MDIDKLVLNIPELKQVLKNNINDLNSLLNKEIRVIGLRSKIEKRIELFKNLQLIINDYNE